MNFRRQPPKYELKEINEYIANYFDILVHSKDVNEEAMLEVMRLVIERFNEYLLKQTEGKGK